MKKVFNFILFVAIAQQLAAMDKNEKQALDAYQIRSEADFHYEFERQPAIIQKLIERGIKPIIWGSTWGRRPVPLPQTLDHMYPTLHDAAKSNDVGAMKEFLKKGADINGFNEDGDCPLHCALDYRALDATELLAEEGADQRLFDRNHKISPELLITFALDRDRDKEPFEAIFRGSIKAGERREKAYLAAQAAQHAQAQSNANVIVQQQKKPDLSARETMARRSERIKEILKQKNNK